MIEIDGSKFEGGGQIVRTALALSMITQKPFRVSNIRKGRKVGGLKSQHLHSIKALQMLSNAQAEGAELGSKELLFYPGKMQSKKITVDIGTAGSITLLLQSLILPCLYAPRKVIIEMIGGTDVKWSPSIDYFVNVFLPYLRPYAKAIDFSLEKRGYYPKGNGKITVSITPKKEINNKIVLEKQGKLVQIKGISHASTNLLKGKVAERQAEHAQLTLSSLNVPIRIRTEYQETFSTGSGITLWAQFENNDKPMILGTDNLGERGKKAELVGQEAALALKKEIKSKAALDMHLADQLIPFIALFGSTIKPRQISNHTLANIYVCKKFLGECLEVKENSIKSAK